MTESKTNDPFDVLVSDLQAKIQLISKGLETIAKRPKNDNVESTLSDISLYLKQSIGCNDELITMVKTAQAIKDDTIDSLLNEINEAVSPAKDEKEAKTKQENTEKPKDLIMAPFKNTQFETNYSFQNKIWADFESHSKEISVTKKKDSFDVAWTQYAEFRCDVETIKFPKFLNINKFFWKRESIPYGKPKIANDVFFETPMTSKTQDWLLFSVFWDGMDTFFHGHKLEIFKLTAMNASLENAIPNFAGKMRITSAGLHFDSNHRQWCLNVILLMLNGMMGKECGLIDQGSIKDILTEDELDTMIELLFRNGNRNPTKVQSSINYDIYYRNYILPQLAIILGLPLSRLGIDKIMQLSFVQRFINNHEESYKNRQECHDYIKEKILQLKENKKLYNVMIEYGIYARCTKQQYSKNESECIKNLLKLKSFCTIENNLITINEKNDANQFETYTLLHHAAFCGYGQFAKLLLRLGADMNYIEIPNDMSQLNKSNSNPKSSKGLKSKAKLVQSKNVTPYEIAKPNVKQFFDAIQNNNEGNKQKIEAKYWDLREQAAHFEIFMNNYGCNEKLTGSKGILSYDEAMKAMSGICGTVINCLKCQLPISDELLCFCWHFTQKYKKKNLEKEMIDVLSNLIQKLLEHDSGEKSRNRFWFKQEILESNIWYQTFVDKNNKNRLLYDEIVDQIKGEFDKIDTFLQNGIKSEESESKCDWDKVLNIENFGVCDSIRQDYCIDKASKVNLMSHGTHSYFTEDTLFEVSADIEEFDVHQEYSLKGYLTMLLLNAHIVDKPFHFDIQDKIFSQQYCLDHNAVYQRAPVKLAQRAILKAQTDYGRSPFPATAQICDIVRGSISFENCKDLLDGMDHFMKCVEQGKGGVIKKIVRIKNGFEAIKNGNISYADVKFNVIIESKQVQVIGEIQFLLKWMLEAKVMGHFLYSIVRRKEWIDSVVTLINDDKDSKQYEANILSTIENGDYNRLGKEMILNCHQIMNMRISSNENKLLLYNLCQSVWPKGVKLFVAGVTWYTNYDLKNKNFGNEYFQSKESLEMDEDGFFAVWGSFPTNLKLSPNKYKIMEIIMRSQFTNIQNDQLVYQSCQQDCFDFFKIIRKYRSKDEAIIKGLNAQHPLTGRTPLTTLICTSHCSVPWLELLASFDGFDINAKCQTGQTALEFGLERSKGGKRIKPEGLKWIQQYKSESNKKA